MTIAAYQPTLKLVSNVSTAPFAVVTTSNPHGYLSGWFVRVFVPDAYQMSIPHELTQIKVLSANQFQTSIDTTSLSPFTVPASPLGFTQAQCVPLSGADFNTLSPTPQFSVQSNPPAVVQFSPFLPDVVYHDAPLPP